MIGGGFTRGNPVQHWHSIDTVNDGVVPPLDAPAYSQVWPSANLSIYVPVIVRHAVLVKALWFACSLAGTGNVDLGLYSAGGVALLRSGSVAKVASTRESVWDCTDTAVGPGLYYLALASDSSTDTFYGFSLSSPFLAAMGVLSESVFPLPATATFSLPQTLSQSPVIGMLLNTLVT